MGQPFCLPHQLFFHDFLFLPRVKGAVGSPQAPPLELPLLFFEEAFQNLASLTTKFLRIIQCLQNFSYVIEIWKQILMINLLRHKKWRVWVFTPVA